MCTVSVKRNVASMCIIEDNFGNRLISEYFFFNLHIQLIFMLMSLEMSVQYFCYKLFNK